MKREISVHISGLFSLSFKLDSKGHPIPINKEIGARDSWLDMLFEDKTTMDLNFLTSGFSHTWEARYAVVQKYVETVIKLQAEIPKLPPTMYKSIGIGNWFTL